MPICLQRNILAGRKGLAYKRLLPTQSPTCPKRLTATRHLLVDQMAHLAAIFFLVIASDTARSPSRSGDPPSPSEHPVGRPPNQTLLTARLLFCDTRLGILYTPRR